MKLYLLNHEKMRKSWLNFGEDKKKEVRKKFKTCEIFQEIGSSTYLEKLALSIKLEGYFRKVIPCKVDYDSKPYESI